MADVDDYERLLDDLLEAEIFEASADGELHPTESFRRTREEYRDEVAGLDDDEFDEELSAFTSADGVTPPDVGVDALGDAKAIYHAAESMDRERSMLAAVALQRIEAANAASGVPDGFVELNGEEIDGFMRSNPAAVVYFWREDCDPCDGVREIFEALLADGEIPEQVGLGAVYGPDSAELVRERYQVAVAPTTLFCVDGRIDSRIIGDSEYNVLRTEIRTIADSIG